MDIEKSKELWDRLANEPRRAFEAFQTFLSIPSGERTVVEAYRSHVDNPQATKISDTWVRWSRDFAWRERAAAYDDRMASKRREAFERGIEEEAERQGTLAERNRNRMNELMTTAYQHAMAFFESLDPEYLRAQDAIQIIKLHIEQQKNDSGLAPQEREDTWTEEDDAEFADILNEIEAEVGPEEGTDDDRAEEGEDGQN